MSSPKPLHFRYPDVFSSRGGQVLSVPGIGTMDLPDAQKPQPLKKADVDDRVKFFRQADEERNSMVTTLVDQLEELRKELGRVQDDYNNEADSRRRLQREVKGLYESITDHKRTVVSFPLS